MRPGQKAMKHESVLKALHSASGTPRLRRYIPTLQNLFDHLITRIARPREVLVNVSDSEAEMAPSHINLNTVERQIYEIERDLLVYLSHIQPDFAERQLLKALTSQRSNPHTLSYDLLNSICWAIGSVSGTMRLLSLPPSFSYSFLC